MKFRMAHIFFTSEICIIPSPDLKIAGCKPSAACLRLRGSFEYVSRKIPSIKLCDRAAIILQSSEGKQIILWRRKAIKTSLIHKMIFFYDLFMLIVDFYLLPSRLFLTSIKIIQTSICAILVRVFMFSSSTKLSTESQEVLIGKVHVMVKLTPFQVFNLPLNGDEEKAKNLQKHKRTSHGMLNKLSSRKAALQGLTITRSLAAVLNTEHNFTS